MKLTPLDIQQQQFRTALMGFDKKEVDTFLDLLANDVEELVRENNALKDELNQRFASAGVEVLDAKLTHLAYAPEIAQVMLRRQQATAIVSARHQIVAGAVGMVEAALRGLSERNLVDLDDERKAAMVSNLLVVLCSDHDAQPVINTGTLYN